MELNKLKDTKKENVCEGLFFRGYSSMFFDYNTGRVERKEGVRLLKRKSCKGGDKCRCGKIEGPCDWYLIEQISDSIDCDTFIMPEIEDGALYRICITNVSVDWGTGVAGDWDLELRKVEE